RGLIRYLMKNHHTSPLEFCEISFHVKLPIYVARQWFRHRTFNFCEISYRFSEFDDEFQSTGPESWRTQSSVNKQGSDGNINSGIGIFLSRREEELLSMSQEIYHNRLKCGVAREQARKDLPVSSYTQMVCKVD